MSILNNLPTGAPAGAPAPQVPAQPVAAPQAAPPPTLHPLIVGLATGKIPGLNIPHGYENPEAESLLKPALAVGLKLFKPVHDKSIQVSVVNPKTVNPEALRNADHHNTLQKMFPSITSFFPHQAKQDKSAKAAGKPPTSPAGNTQSPPPVAGAPAPNPTTGVPANSPSTTPVPVLPKPTRTTAALTNDRVKNLNPGTPTSRPIPGGGLVLNGLLKQVV